jgi:hypothetical protein
MPVLPGLFGSMVRYLKLEGVSHICHLKPIENPFVNYIVRGLAMLIEGSAWYLAFNEFTKARGKWCYNETVLRGKDLTIFVVLFEDSAAMLALIIAFLGVLLSQ